MHRFIFAGQTLCALSDRALFWPAQRALLVADLHLEKASWLAARGQMLPPYDSHATLTRLAALVAATDARLVWALGDSFHDSAGPERIDAASVAILGQIARQARLCWIEGNHDRRVNSGANLPGEAMVDLVVDGIMLRHESDPDETLPEISGHFHPKVRVATRARNISRPCFALTHDRLILPAFGALTGGMFVTDAAIRDRIGSRGEALIATSRSLTRVPFADSNR